MSDERTRWVQVFARLKPGYTVEVGAGAAAGAVHRRSAQYEMTLPGAKDWSQFQREQLHEGPA